MSSELSPANKIPHPPSHRWGNRILMVVLAAVVFPACVSILYTHAPTEYTFLPCLFHQTTGLHCPGCGATRCVYSLLHGDLQQAFAYNPLFVLFLPFLTVAVLGMAFTLWTGRKAPGPRMHPWIGKLILVILIVYWIARNIDVYPLNLLAPHQI